jgi:hypothetical protein
MIPRKNEEDMMRNPADFKAMIWMKLTDVQQTKISKKAGPGEFERFFLIVPTVTKNEEILDLAKRGLRFFRLEL